MLNLIILNNLFKSNNNKNKIYLYKIFIIIINFKKLLNNIKIIIY